MVDKDRQELYRGIWNLANSLRGSIDAWEFKNYVLGFLFYRYISEDFASYIKNRSSIPPGFEYANERDDAAWIEHMKEMLIQEKGYFIYPSDLFISMKRKVDKGEIEDLNEEVWSAFNRIEMSTQGSNARKDFEGLFKLVDLSDNKLGKEIMQKNKKIKELIIGVGEMNCRIGDADIFGDAYEYLIGMYAANAGKAGGEFYTPPEVSELLVKLVSVGYQGRGDKDGEIRTVYDPTCGSGSLLLKFGHEKEIQFFGQEINFTTYNLCRMNMFLHKIGYNNFDIALGNTLTDDKFKDLKFDAIVSNPPYGTKWEGSDNPDLRDDPRFAGPGALAPKSKSDFAFIMHSLYHLEDHGVAAIVCFPGILFRDKAEKEIRKYLIDNNYIDAVIQLPENLFFGTSIATCILILKKNKKDTSILFINASDEFVKAKGRSKLSEENIRRIFHFYKERQDVDWYVKLASKDDAKKNEYDLSVHEYVIREEAEEQIDIDKLNAEITQLSEDMYKLNIGMDAIIKKMNEQN